MDENSMDRYEEELKLKSDAELVGELQTLCSSWLLLFEHGNLTPLTEIEVMLNRVAHRVAASTGSRMGCHIQEWQRQQENDKKRRDEWGRFKEWLKTHRGKSKEQ